MMDLDITIERIDNGYIITGKGVTKGKHYIRNLEEFAQVCIVESLREADKAIKESDCVGNIYKLKLESSVWSNHSSETN